MNNIAKTPRVSIGIVVYNGVAHIGSALRSVVNQDYKNIEIIVVDGGSSDGTLNILEEFSQYLTVKISEPDLGIYDAMNKVCSLATGDWLIFLGCDDVLLNTIDKVVMKMNSPDVVYYGDVIFGSTGAFYGGEFSKRRLLKMNICHQALFYPKSIYKSYLYDLKYKWLADYALNIKLFGLGVPFFYTNVMVSIYNDKGGSSQGDADFEKARLSLIRSAFGLMYVAIYVFDKTTEKLKIRASLFLKRLLGKNNLLRCFL
nr:glycosyltransferase family 2 protein [Methylomonas sp. SURF-2]